MQTFRSHALFGIIALAMAASGFSWVASPPGDQEPAPAAPSMPNADADYVGAAKCKTCHEGGEKGSFHSQWSESLHANAYEVLGTPAAKEVAKARGIDDPQKAAECLECHVTAHGVDEKQIKKSFKIELGVQCESCHGPGGDHAKSRMRAAMKGEGKGQPGPLGIPAGEMHVPSDEALCKSCHNPKSPSYKEFVLKEYLPKIRHLHPNRAEPRWVAEDEETEG